MIALVRQICLEQWGVAARTDAGSRLNNDSTPDSGSIPKFRNTIVAAFVHGKQWRAFFFCDPPR